MANSKLNLKTTLCLNDLADQATHLLWDHLARQPGASHLDAHRFPGLSRAVNAVLLQHIGTCLICSEPTSCDTWARTGNSCQVGNRPACPDHTRRLLTEAGPELQRLLADLEKEISQFLSRHQPERAAFNHGVAENIHRAIAESIAPYLYQNIAASCCTEQAA